MYSPQSTPSCCVSVSRTPAISQTTKSYFAAQCHSPQRCQCNIALERLTSKCALNMALRKLWQDHVDWTRIYIIYAVNKLDAQPTLGRLLRNQEDIGTAFGAAIKRPIVGSSLTVLLKEHIAIAGEIVGAALQSNSTKQKDAIDRWYVNADKLAELLGTILGDTDTLRTMLYEHLSTTLQEAVALIQKQDGIAEYDIALNHMLHFADLLTNLIAVRQ